MARLQVVPLPTGAFGILIDQVEVAEVNSWAGAPLIKPLWEISDEERGLLESQLEEHSQFVVFTTASIDVAGGGA